MTGGRGVKNHSIFDDVICERPLMFVCTVFTLFNDTVNFKCSNYFGLCHLTHFISAN